MAKIIKDCIYGHVEIPELCIKFMDTPECQRLRRVGQLSTVRYAYPSAVHSRFEHSIGVMYLAGQMVDRLRNFTCISDRTKQLIQLAAMYHDIGHFAYSHLFDTFLVNYRSENKKDLPTIFTFDYHEHRSIYILHVVNKRLQLLTYDEEKFVSNVITGYVPNGSPHYLYQIVCNEECGIDVDKMDYLRRDSYHTGFPGFQSEYIILNSVIDNDGHLAFKEKLRNDIIDLFATRNRMFNNVYKHHTTLKVEKIYYCAMKQLGNKVFMYGDKIDDFNIETLIRSTESLADLMNCLDNRKLYHECEHCEYYKPTKNIKQSGDIDNVRFI